MNIEPAKPKTSSNSAASALDMVLQAQGIQTSQTVGENLQAESSTPNLALAKGGSENLHSTDMLDPEKQMPSFAQQEQAMTHNLSTALGQVIAPDSSQKRKEADTELEDYDGDFKHLTIWSGPLM